MIIINLYLLSYSDASDKFGPLEVKKLLKNQIILKLLQLQLQQLNVLNI